MLTAYRGPRGNLGRLVHGFILPRVEAPDEPSALRLLIFVVIIFGNASKNKARQYKSKRYRNHDSDKRSNLFL